MGREVTKEEAEEIIAADRHKELTSSIKAMAIALSNNNDKSVVDAINKQGNNIEKLVNAIQSIPKPEKYESPIVNVEVNPKEFVSSINKICDDIVASNNKVIEALEKRILPDTFTLVKTYGGFTESVKVNYKPANQITIKN